jgi:hypothetical protein
MALTSLGSRWVASNGQGRVGSRAMVRVALGREQWSGSRWVASNGQDRVGSRAMVRIALGREQWSGSRWVASNGQDRVGSRAMVRIALGREQWSGSRWVVSNGQDRVGSRAMVRVALGRKSRSRDTKHAIRVFSRDGNAAKNLWLVLREETAGRPRPSYLTIRKRGGSVGLNFATLHGLIQDRTLV